MFVCFKLLGPKVNIKFYEILKRIVQKLFTWQKLKGEDVIQAYLYLSPQ